MSETPPAPGQPDPILPGTHPEDIPHDPSHPEPDPQANHPQAPGGQG